MIPKSGSRFSEKIMRQQNLRAGRRFEEKASRSSDEDMRPSRSLRGNLSLAMSQRGTLLRRYRW
jgi:hypothetical protein